MDMNVVNSYVERLRSALGDAEAFAVVYSEMENDRAVRQPEAVGIAKSFFGDASSKLAKSEAFRRIRGPAECHHGFAGKVARSSWKIGGLSWCLLLRYGRFLPDKVGQRTK